MVKVANMNSKAVDFLMRTLASFLTPVKVILADGGYRGKIMKHLRNKFGYLINVVMRSDDKKTDFKQISKRWTFSWFDNDKRL